MTAKRIHYGEVEIPEGVNVELLNEKTIKVSGPLGTVIKDFGGVPVKFKLEDNRIKYEIYWKGKKGYALINTIAGRIRNVFTGVTKGFVYKMKAYYVHFPMNIRVENDYVIISNFAGERGVRRAKILPGVNVRVIKKGTDIDLIITGIDKDLVGQTAANIYLATKVKNKDPRVFLDGIYLYYKGVGINGQEKA
ncbi:50S ribosomal protein L6 [Candidatus Geothermarchaeota archaeon]|nr:MAG: 50S ribosomal protein L6 [Candidatus Geothermarchaeota archaeon]RLG62958.1 MAG: 50S ribosomal protein L6 [Candidatus Geothermarchaeota archaeon]